MELDHNQCQIDLSQTFYTKHFPNKPTDQKPAVKFSH